MKKKLTALILAAIMALPIGNVTAFGAVTEDAEITAEAGETTSEPAAEEIQTVSSAVAASVTGSALTIREERSAEPIPEPYDLSKANEPYRNMVWDEYKGMYLYSGEDGSEIWMDPEDPEFYDYVFGEKGKPITEEEEESSNGITESNQALGFSGGIAVTVPAQVAGKTMYHGIDVSYHQGNINWAAAAADGVQFVIIRIGYTGESTGTANPDPMWANYVKGAYSAGIRNIGLYYYSQALNTAEAQAEANYTAALLNASGLASYINMPIFMDYEYGNTSMPRLNRYTQSADPNVNQAIVNAFCDGLYNSGYRNVGVYANQDMWNSRLNVAAKSPYAQVWVARWSTALNYTGPLQIWQYSNVGIVNGIGTRVDSNYWWPAAAQSGLTLKAEQNKLEIEEKNSKDKFYASTKITATTSPANATIKSWEVLINSVPAPADSAVIAATEGNTKEATFRAYKAGTYQVKATSSAGLTKTIEIKVTYKLQPEWFQDRVQFVKDGKGTYVTGLGGWTEDLEGNPYYNFVTGPAPVYDGTAKKLSAYFGKTPMAKTANHAEGDVTYSVYNLSGEKKLESVTDVSLLSCTIDGVAYKGLYPVTIEGTGNYSGTVTKYFRIDPKSLTADTDGDGVPDVTASFPTNLKTQDYVSDMRDVLIQVIDRTVADSKRCVLKSADQNMDGDYTVDTEKSDAPAIGKELTVWIKGTRNYTGELKSEDTTVFRKGTLSSSMLETIPNQYYTGLEIRPEIILFSGGQKLKESKDGVTGDFTATFSNNYEIGTATVLIRGLGDTGEGAYSGSFTSTFKIVAHPLTEPDITVDDIPDQGFTGTAIKPSPVVKLWDGTGEQKTLIRTLTEGTDYTVSYASNKAVGTAKATVKGKGKFNGSVVKTFYIEGGAIEDGGGNKYNDDPVEGLQVYVEGTPYWNADGSRNYYATPYTSKAIKPKVKMQLNGSQLAASSYTLTYENNTEIGTACIKIVGKGSCYGTKLVYFYITGVDLGTAKKMSYGAVKNQNYQPGGMHPSPVIKYNGITLTEGKDYTISYVPMSSAESRTAVDSITAAGDYRVLVTGTGTTGYSGSYLYPSKFTVKPAALKKANILIENEIDVVSGGAVDPGVVVSVNGIQLVEGTDYIVSYPDQYKTDLRLITKGTKYTLSVKGIGNYSGTVNQKITVYPEGTQGILTSKYYKVMIGGKEAYHVTYTGEAQKPSVFLMGKSYDVPIPSPEDAYTISYSNNINAGKAVVTIKGKNGYVGLMRSTFDIDSLKVVDIYGGVDIGYTGSGEGSALVIDHVTVRNMTFALQNTDLTYNGKAQKPTPVVTYGSKTLKNKTDYDAIYENEQSTDAGVYSVTIRLKGNFSGEQTLYYRIKQLDLSKLTVQIPKQNYSGNAVTPDISTWIIKSGSSKVTVVSGCGLIAQNWTNNVEVTANASVTLAVDSVNKNFMPTSSKKVTFSIVKNLIKPEKMRVKLVETGEDGQETFYKVYANGTSDLAADYTGGCIDPGVTVYDRETGKLLIAGKDYKVEYLNDKEPTDKAMIRISGINGYGGSMMVYYKINGLDLAAGSPVISGAGIVVGYTPYTTVTLFTSPDPAKVTVSTDDEKYMVKDDSYTYDGTQKKPYARVIYKGDKLTEGKDYTLKFVNNVNAGTATVQVIGKGKYRGTVEKNFFICPVTNYYLQNRFGATWTEQFKITGISPTKVYVLENRAAVPKVTVTVMGKKLVLGKDYTVYMRLNDGSNGVLSVCGIGNYKGLNNSVEFRYRFK